MMPEERLMVLRRMCSDDTPAFIVSRGLTPPKEMIEAASERNIPVLSSPISTSRFIRGDFKFF